MRKRCRPFFLVAIILPLIAVVFPYNAISQYSLTGTTYTQNFNGLGSSSNTVTGGNLNNIATSLNGWYFSEALANANTTITSGYGSSTTGDTYNFGITAGTDRTLGGLQSGTLNPTFGFYFVNNTNSTITSLTISYSGKTWRVGATGHQDKLQFEYSATNTTVGALTGWTAYTPLDYQNNSAGAIANGISGPIQTASVSNTLSSLTINDGSTFFIRWTDFDATGADDGIGIDDLTITATTTTTPTISLSTVHPAAANIAASSTNNIIAIYKLFATNAAINITNAGFVAAGTFINTSDITNFKVWQNSIPSISGGTLVATNTTASSGNTFSYSTGFTSIPAGNTSYLIITVDVASSPTALRTVSLAADPVTNFTFSSSGTVTVIPSSGSLTTGNAFTIGSAATGGGFQPGKLAVLRIGDGGTSLANTVPVSIMQFNTTGTNQTGFVSAQFPTTTVGSANRLMQNGASTSEGEITVSADGNYLTAVGYDVAANNASVAASTTVATVIGRVSIDGSTNTSTVLARNTSFRGGNIRSGVTTDGSNFWLAGTSSGATAGVRYALLGAVSASSVATTPDNTRIVNIFKNSSGNNQIYTSTASGVAFRIASVGTGTPTASGQTLTNLPGFLTSTGDPYGFVLLDADATIPGPDLLYVASLSAPAPVGLLKYYYNSATSLWVSAGSLTGNIRGITAAINCSGTFDLYITWSTSGAARPTLLYKFTDVAGRTGNITSNGSALSTVGTQLNNGTTDPGTNYAYGGGISFTPLPDVIPVSNTILTSSTYRNITVNSGITVTLGNDITVLGDIVVNSGGILDCSSYHLFNTTDFRSTFTLNSGGTLKIGDPNGITASAASGSVQTCSRTYNAGGNYIYTGTNNQVTGDGLPATVTGSVTVTNTGIAGDNSLTPTTTGGTITTLNLTSGYLNIGTGNTLNIASGGTVNGTGGDFATGTAGGTLNFPGTGTFTTTVQLNPYNVYISGGVNFGTATNINGTLRINTGGFVNANAPSYATSSLLQYYTGTTYGRGSEWSQLSGASYPYNVQVSNNTTLNYPNGFPNSTRAMEGSLTIDAGSSLYMNYGTPGTNASLTVNGNITVNGNLTLGDASGGDLNFGGNWTSGAASVIDFKQRIVNFNGGALQTITTAKTSENFDYIGVNNTSAGGVQISSGTTVNITTSAGGNGLQLLGTGPFDINGTTCTLGNSTYGSIQVATNAQNIISSTGTGVFVLTGGPVTTPVVFNSAGSGSLTFSSAIRVELNGGFNFGTNLTTINGTLRMKSGAFVSNNAPIYGTGSLLQYYTGTSPYNRTLEWSSSSGAGYPYNVQISNNGVSNTDVNPGGTSNTGIALNAAGSVTIDAGCSLYMDYGATDMTVPLTVGADLIINGNLSESDVSGGDVIVKGNWYNNTGAVFSPKTRAVYFSGTVAQTIGGTQSTTFDYLINSNTTADVSMLQNVTVNQKITLQTNSVLAINGKTVTLNATVDNTVGNAGTFRGSTSSNMFIGGSGSLFGTLLFTPTAQILDSLTMDRTGVTGTAALLGANNDLVTTNLVLNNGILTSGNNLLTVTNVSGSARAATVAFTNDRDTTDLKQSFVALCDGSNNPVTDTTGAKGFKIKSVGTTEKIIPIGYSYNTAPNRISLKDELGNTADDYTITLFKGDILGTLKPRVNRIWHIKKATTGSTNISMKLYFFKRTALYGSATNDELEDGFIWSDARLLHRVYANTIPNGGFTNTSGGVGGAADVIDFTPRTSYTEIYAAYTWGISPDNTYPSPPADGIRDFSGISYFSVANVYNFILPVTIVNLKAYQQGSAIKIDWTSLTENNVARYEVQRAANTLDFTTIGTQDASPAYAPEKNYSFTDLLPLNGNNYYRISAIDKDGKVIVSNIVMVTVGKGKEGISIYPNPVKGRAATIQFTNMQQGKYTIVVYSALGTKLLQKTIEHVGGSAAYKFILPQNFASGMYHVMIMGDTIKVQKNLLVE
ncbi:MAG TPA: hypothetical protein PLP23_06255 [Panacibacter sp.]|nr:hypothetical protein [Panacibacter sp.]